MFTLLDKYRPEDKAAKKARLLAIAESKAKGVEVEDKAPANVVKFGLNHVTALIEQKKAKLVLIAHDVEPIELVVWLPALCKRMGVPYAIVKSKSRLGQVVHQKKASCLAIVNVDKEDMHDFAQVDRFSFFFLFILFFFSFFFLDFFPFLFFFLTIPLPSFFFLSFFFLLAPNCH